MKKERVACPVCKKRILDLLNGEASFETKCIHCGNIVMIQCSNKKKKEKPAINLNDVNTT